METIPSLYFPFKIYYIFVINTWSKNGSFPQEMWLRSEAAGGLEASALSLSETLIGYQDVGPRSQLKTE